jgi:hypothetical protein
MFVADTVRWLAAGALLINATKAAIIVIESFL